MPHAVPANNRRMAVEDFGGKVGGRAVQVLSGDHQNKPDVGSAIVRGWLDQDGVDLVADVPNSAVALAVADLVRQRNKVFLGSGAGTADFTGGKCSPSTVHWPYDTWQAGHGLARAVQARGGTKRCLLMADYACGHALTINTRDAVAQAGGQVLGETTIRADGRALHPVHVFQTKAPSESKGGWDYLKLVSTIPAQQAYRPLSEGHCPLVR